MFTSEFDECLAAAPQWYADILKALKKEKNDEALRQAREQLAISQENMDQVGEILAMCLVAKAQLAKSDHWNSILTAEECVGSARKRGRTKELAIALRMLAECQLKDRECDKALAAADEARLIYINSQSQEGVAAAMTTMAKVYFAQKQTDKALDLINDARRLYEELGIDLGIASILKVAADVKISEQRYYHAGLAIEDMVKHCRKANEVEGEAFANLFAAEVYHSQGDLQGAVDRAQDAAQLFAQLGITKRKAAALLIISKAFQQADQLQDALEAAQASVRFFQGGRDKKGQASALIVLAEILHAMKQFDDSGKKYEEASFIFRQLKNKREEGRALVAFATSQIRMFEEAKRGFGAEEYEQVVKNARRAVELFDDGSLECGVAMLTQAAALQLSKKFDDALAIASQAQELFEAKKAVSEQSKALIALGNAHFGKDNKEAAVEMLEKAKSIAEEVGEGAAVKEASKRLKEIGKSKLVKQGADPMWDTIYIYQGSMMIDIDKYEPRAMRTGAATNNSKGDSAGDKNIATAQRQRVLYNLRMQREPNVNLTSLAAAV